MVTQSEGVAPVSDSRATIAYVSDADQAAELAAAARIPESDVDKILIDAGEDTLDELQDAVYAGSVGRVLIPSLSILGPDLMAQEAILASWVEKSIAVFCRDEPDLGADDPARRRLRGVLGEIEEYGKIPWVP
jgi:hypothetical protein